MKSIWTVFFALAVAAAQAQTTGQGQIRHVDTSMNHLTVLEFGEQVTTLAVGDANSFQIEHHEDKVFIKPLQSGVSTNLFVWTASRELSYELDPSGSLSTMDVLIRAEAAPVRSPVPPQEAKILEEAQHKAALRALTETLAGTEEIAQQSHRMKRNHVYVALEQVYRTGDQIYLRYSITNLTAMPYRLSLPAICAETPTETPTSLLSLRNHQLKSKIYASFKTSRELPLDVAQAEPAPRDLAPNERITGVLSFKCDESGQPRLYQVSFGMDHNQPVAAQVVL